MLRRAAVFALIPAFVIVLAGCSTLPASHLVGAVRSEKLPSAAPTAAIGRSGWNTEPASAIVTITAAPVSATAKSAPMPTGAVLPDASRTPGAVNPAVTQANIQQTICVPKYTAKIRPPASYTNKLKRTQLASGYAYKGDKKVRDYEEDHLISLEIGGSPKSPQNLWPQPYAGSDGAKLKDQVENKLHTLVCSGRLALAEAQHAIATNWWQAYQTYGGQGPAPTSSAAPQHHPGSLGGVGGLGGLSTHHHHLHIELKPHHHDRW